MEWHELKVKTTALASDVVAGILMQCGSGGVAIDDPMDLVNLADDGFGTLKPEIEISSDVVYVSGYFSDDKNILEIKEELQQRLLDMKNELTYCGELTIELMTIAEKDFENSWKQYYKPVRLSKHLTIVPSWEDYQNDAENTNQVIIKIDPGMAFGTGTHPTTKLSLEALEMVLRGGESVIDVGTGSGILSIAAKGFGAHEVTAFDLDTKATKIAKENILLNDYAKDIQVYENNLLVGVDKQVDVIVANILAEILELLVTDAYRNLKANGYLILSGIILPKRDSLVEKLEKTGFVIEQENRIKDWVSLICKKVVE